MKQLSLVFFTVRGYTAGRKNVRKEKLMMIYKNGKTYLLEEDDYCWKITFRREDTVLIFRLRKAEFETADAVKSYVRLCADF